MIPPCYTKSSGPWTLEAKTRTNITQHDITNKHLHGTTTKKTLGTLVLTSDLPMVKLRQQIPDTSTYVYTIAITQLVY